MGAILVGVLLIIFAVFAVLPFSWSLDWANDVIRFIKGGLPVLSVIIGLISSFVGVADIKDKIQVRREDNQEHEAIDENSGGSGESEGNK